jgi:1-acyl-sn-glycerol-3-phosphate acyltransferase
VDFRRAAVSFALKRVINILCRIECREFIEALSKSKPLIIAMNHINFLEVPVMVAYSYPLNVTGVAKIETWDNPFFAFLFNTYRAIPIDRSGAFHRTFAQVQKAIDKGFSVGIFPEGTRSGNGVLGKGKAGIIHLAFEINAPILPAVHYGGENIWENIKHFKRTPFCFRTGRPFKIKFEGRPDHETRDEMLAEVMGRMARLLPEGMRGIYAEQAERECKYLEFL